MIMELNNQFVPEFELVESILKLYGLQLVSYEKAKTGIENTTLIIDNKYKKYVLRVYRNGNKSVTDIKHEVDFIEYMISNGVNVPKIVKNIANQYITDFEHCGTVWHIILMEFVDGEHAVCYPHKLLIDIAKTQAEIHILSKKYTTDSVNMLTELSEDCFIKQIDMAQIKDTQLMQFLMRAENFKISLDPKLPKGLCHLDYDNENILSKNHKVVAVLDFDDLAISPFVVCLAYTLWHVLYSDGTQKMYDYLAEYEKIRPLNNLEKSYLYKIVLFRHYVISSMYILNGNQSKIHIHTYIKLEKLLIKKTLE